MNILLLEDDMALNRAISKVLKLDNNIVTSYMDGQDVYDNLDTQYDLYILDINVPNISGLELLSFINKKNSSSKVIIISVNSDVHSLKEAYKLGCIDYLNKPFHLEELRIKINKLYTDKHSVLSNIKLKDTGDTLTKKEKDLLALLVQNKGLLVTYEMIEENVYKDKSMSMDGLRALVRRLRLKLADDIIQNAVEEGYIINDE